MGGKFRPAHLPPGAGAKTRLKKGENNHTFTEEERARGRRREPNPDHHTPAQLREINRYFSRIGGTTGLAKSLKLLAENEDITSLKDNINLTDAFMLEEIGTLDLDQCGASWERLEQIANDAKGKSGQEAESHLRRMCAVIEEGVEQWRKVNRIRGLQEDRRRLVETQLKVEATAEANISGKRLTLMLMELWETLDANLKDHPLVLQRVGAVLGKMWLGEDIAVSQEKIDVANADT